MNPILPVILSGGAGSRLWPLSRSGYPKQFLNLVEDGQSLFQATLKRLEGITQGQRNFFFWPGARFFILIPTESADVVVIEKTNSALDHPALVSG